MTRKKTAAKPQYKKNSYILAKFIQENEIIDAYPGKFNSSLSIQLNFQVAPIRIGQLLLSGIYRQKINKKDFIVESIMIIIVAILSCGNMIFTILVETVLYRFIIFMPDLQQVIL